MPILLLLALTIPGSLLGQVPSTREVTDRYLELTFGQRYDELLDLYAEDAVFFDPTGEVFSGAVSQGPVEGAERIVQMQRSWGLVGTEFDIRESFTVGEYSLYRGMLSVRYQRAAPWITFPFVTVLRAVSGRVAERLDFGHYVDAFDLGTELAQEANRTEELANAYLEAYLSGDVDAQVSFVAPDVRFQDPTSRVFGPPSGELYVGVDMLEKRRRQVFANIEDFGVDVSESFFAPHHAVYMGTTRYTVSNGQSFAQPAVFVFEVRDGRVARQWDFVDYTVGPLNK